MELPSDRRLRQPIVSMQKAGLRTAAIVNDLLTLARGVAIEKQTMNLNLAIKEYLIEND